LVTLEDAWIKASVEHKTIEIKYQLIKTKNNTSVREITVREVEPDFYGLSKNGKNFGRWGFCRLRGEIRCFSPDSIIEWRYVGDDFTPNLVGRWGELMGIYNQRALGSVKL
jgi:predicted DNA-binding transcriptional regulator YafY